MDFIVPLHKMNAEYNLKYFNLTARISDNSKIEGVNCIKDRFDDSLIKKIF